ncbi:deoxyribonuclease IV [Amedibacillus dolichus]|uniref:deoxyribonuclease IV n=1 Tax=Amedibacillus dolichus TaxID=31971 RepID=UPI001D00556A|nr:deoxyribonuclease IV [Amedibacillus dolichus]MCB5372775.1 deoxyribonuclease IV [Amedibacillus dolichus]
MIIGSHVSMSAPDYVLGSVKEALSYGANALMLYTGAPQNTRRKAMEELKVKEALALLDEHHIPHEHIIVHAPYIINLANCQKQETFELGVEFLRKEIERVKALGAKYLVLHPGSHVQAGEEAGLTRIVEGLDLAMENIGEVEIAIETMAGKGSELGYNFEQIRYLMEHAKHGDRLRVCMDTCHLHDAGFDVSDFDAILETFDRVISLERLVCIHVNDSKNVRGARKDRHANIGFGEIGFDALNRIVHHEKLQHVVKILETPWVDGVAPYKHEIAMLKAGIFDQEIMTKLKNQE